MIRGIIFFFLVLGMIYALVTPPFEASDELWHYPMIRHLADGNALPVQVFDPALAGPWKQEASQPPLYYYIGAVLTFWIDTGDMEAVRWLNPHVDNGVITTDGNVNLAIHDPAANRWQGTFLAIRLVRLLSVALGAWAVVLTFLIGKEIFPDRPTLALGAAAAHAFTPMFLFISGAVNNDNLAIPLASLGLLLLIRLVKRWPDQPRPAVAILRIGVVIGLAVLTKQGTIGLLPLALGTLFIWEWVRLERKPLTYPRFWGLILRTAADFALLLLPVVLIAGWWYWRNVELYGDLLGWNAFIAVLGQRETPASLAQLWDERWGFMLSYWGLFGGVNVSMWEWTYHLLNGLVIVAIPGGIIFLWKRLGQGIKVVNRAGTRETDAPILRWLSWLFDFVADQFGMVASLLLALAVLFGLIQWATTTWSSQGRLVFTAIAPLNIFWIAGLASLVPRRWSPLAAGFPAGILFVLAALSPFLFIQPTYRPFIDQIEQPHRATCVLQNCLAPSEGNFSDQIRLMGYEVEPRFPRPGDRVTVTLEWAALDQINENWSVFVHLNDQLLGIPIAQRDMYLGQGLVATSFLKPGDHLFHQVEVAIPPTAVTPATLDLVVGLYQFESGGRLSMEQGDLLVLEQLPLAAAAGTTPNPVSINFGKQFELVGFDLDPRRGAAGESVHLTTYWRPLTGSPVDYTFFAQLVGEDTTRWAAADIGLGTSGWAADEIYQVEAELVVREETPPGIYPLRIGIYKNGPDGIVNLQRVTAEGRLTDDFLNLTVVRVDE